MTEEEKNKKLKELSIEGLEIRKRIDQVINDAVDFDRRMKEIINDMKKEETGEYGLGGDWWKNGKMD